MNHNIKKRSPLLFSILIFFLLAVPVFAADSSKEEQALVLENSRSFVTSLFQATEEQLSQLQLSGGFYAEAAEKVTTVKKELGSFVSLDQDMDVSEAEGNITVSGKVHLEKGSAAVSLTVANESGQLTPKSFSAEKEETLGVKMKQAASNTVLGLVIVFGILFFLTLIISLFRLIPNKELSEEEPIQHTELQIDYLDPSAAVRSSKGTEVSCDEDEIVAVIAAAIAAAEADAPSENGYIVRSIQRKRSTHRWKRA